jgi:hypothetical protein
VALAAVAEGTGLRCIYYSYPIWRLKRDRFLTVLGKFG